MVGGVAMARERPDLTAIFSMIDDLRQTVGSVNETHQKMAKVTGVAWSDDRLIKATVGPRGQLVELEIDPRVYRQPNSKALAATIVATVRRASEEAMAKTQEIAEAAMPSDFGATKLGNLSMARLMRSHDADLPKRLESGDE
jgi:DNA-binding protein YbaB